MGTVYIIKNAAHNLMEEQVEILNDCFPQGFEFVQVPSEGWNLKQMKHTALELCAEVGNSIIFVSPVPVVLGICAKNEYVDTYVFHNDKREKKELPNGKIIFTVAQTGWQLVKIR